MRSNERLGTGPRECVVGGEISITPGEWAKYGKSGYADILLVMRCTQTVTAAGAVTAMTEAQRKAYLATLTLDLRLDGGGNDVKKTSQDGNNPLHPYQTAKFSDLGRVARRLVEKYVTNFSDATTGLAKAFITGANTLTFDVLVSFGQVEFVTEDEQLFGVGPDQLALVQLVAKPNSDYFASISSDLVADKFKIDFYTVRIPARGRRIGPVPILRKTEPASTSYEVETPGGVPLDALDMKRPYATRVKTGQLTVTVGESVINKPPDTLTTVRNNYVDLNADVTASMEGLVNEEGTEVYAQPDTDVRNLRCGRLVATQEELQEAWNVQSTHLPLMDHASSIAYLRMLAERLPGDTALCVVNTPKLMGINVEGDNSGLLAVLGMTAYYSTEPEAAKYPHLRISKSGKWEVIIPSAFREKAALAFLSAKNDTTKGAGGDAAGMDAAVNDVVSWIASVVDDEVKGLPRSDGKGGPETEPYRLVAAQVRGDAAQLSRAV